MMEAAWIRNSTKEANTISRSLIAFLETALAQTKEGFEEGRKKAREIYDEIEEDLKFDLLERRIDHGK